MKASLGNMDNKGKLWEMLMVGILKKKIRRNQEGGMLWPHAFPILKICLININRSLGKGKDLFSFS
jgi:hypothetical protein